MCLHLFLAYANRLITRIIKITKKIEEHEANLIDDFIQINDVALNSKKQKRISEWIDQKVSNTYIRLSENLDNCSSLNKWKK